MRVRGNLDARAWQDVLASFPIDRRDVLFSPAFHEVHAAQGDGQPYCCVVEEDDRQLLIPGLRRTISGYDGALWDLQTCRTGCAGPLSNSDDAMFLEHAWTAWSETMRGEGGVAAFFRLHPLIGNERWLPTRGRVHADRTVAFVNLADGPEVAWTRAEPRHRNMVRKAQRLGAVVSWNRRHDEFAALYERAMSRLDADSELRVTSAYFAALWTMPSAEVATIQQGGAVVAGAVFLFSDRWAHYHLAAREPDAGNQLGNLLLESACWRAADRGLRGVYLGGGRSIAADDELLRFKRSVASELLPYKVACVPIDEQRYAALVEAWTTSVGQSPTWLLGYRQPKPTHA